MNRNVSAVESVQTNWTILTEIQLSHFNETYPMHDPHSPSVLSPPDSIKGFITVCYTIQLMRCDEDLQPAGIPLAITRRIVSSKIYISILLNSKMRSTSSV